MTGYYLLAAYVVIGGGLAVWLARAGEEAGWCSTVFFMWPLMLAAGCISLAIHAPGDIAHWVARKFSKST